MWGWVTTKDTQPGLKWKMGIISKQFISLTTVIRLGVQLGHIQRFFSHILHLIPTVYLTGKAEIHVRIRISLKTLKLRRWMTCRQFYPHQLAEPRPGVSAMVSSASPLYPLLQGRHRTTVMHKRGCSIPAQPLNKRRRCKQTKLCWEFFIVRIAYTATHIQEMSGLCEYLKINNTSQVENELRIRTSYLRLQNNI